MNACFRGMTIGLLIGLVGTVPLHGQDADPGKTWTVTQHESAASLRGLVVVDQQVAWASGTGGTVLRTTDGGASWQSIGPADGTDLDFRDVHAWDQQRAVIASAGAPARIYRTDDGGANWSKVFEDLREPVFFDAMAFWDATDGIIFSDPVDGRILLIETRDAGNTWREVPADRQPAALVGEAGFAASGTCLCVIDELLFIGLGGQRDQNQPAGGRILKSEDRGVTWEAGESPLAASQSSGVFSIAFANRDHGVAVGGDYRQPDQVSGTACYTTGGGSHWQPAQQSPAGYRSCVAVRYRDDGYDFVCVGPTGTDWSRDSGRTWQPLDPNGFHAVAFSPDGRLGIATGADGRIGIWQPTQ